MAPPFGRTAGGMFPSLADFLSLALKTVVIIALHADLFVITLAKNSYASIIHPRTQLGKCNAWLQ
jgi:hypothetical protein